MNRNSTQKNKLKTLPNQLTTQNQEFFFKSACEDNLSHRINLASPTFASSDLVSISEVKENCRPKENSSKMPTLDFLKGQNQRLIEKCKALESKNEQLSSEGQILGKKFEACKKAMQGKLQKVAKYMIMQNSSKEHSNIDIYLQLQIFRQDYKQKTQHNEILKTENQSLTIKIKQLEAIILNYTNKLEKKAAKEEAQKSERKHQLEVEEVKKSYESKIKQLESEKKQKEEGRKKIKEDYERLKFLKEQIQKKRQEDLKFREEVTKTLQGREKQIQQLKRQNISLKNQQENLIEQKEEIERKLLFSQKNIEEQIKVEKEEAQKLQLDLISLQTEQKKLKRRLEAQNQQNAQLEQQMNKLRSENEYLTEQMSQLNKSKLACQQNEQKLSHRISQLEMQVAETELECSQVRKQFQEWMNEHEKGRQEERSSLESKLNQIIQDLNQQIDNLRKAKEILEGELESEREKSEKMSQELQITSRKIEEYSEVKESSKRSETTQPYPRHKGLPTKTISQLRMVESILARILGIEDAESNKLKGTGLGKEHFAETIVGQIAKEAEEIADIFDGLEGQIDSLRQQVRNKEEVISKLLRFTPEEKKANILEYLNVMENIEQFTTDQVYKATRDIEEEANQWKRHINNLFCALEKNQEELMSLKRQWKTREPLRQYQQQERYPEKWDLPRRKYGAY